MSQLLEAQIKYVVTPTWPTTAATQIMATVAKTCQTRGTCSVMLTGGRSAPRLYEAWAALPARLILSATWLLDTHLTD